LQYKRDDKKINKNSMMTLKKIEEPENSQNGAWAKSVGTQIALRLVMAWRHNDAGHYRQGAST
jgi:hypothetical protein